MKVFVLTILSVMLLAITLFSQDEAVISHYGTLKVGGVLQSTFTYNLDTLEVQTQFAVRKSIFLFWGTILQDNVKYFVKGGGMTSPYIIETKLMFDNYIPMTSIAIGRYLPNFTYYMSRNCAMLDLIEYPLLVQGYAMWQQIGVQTTTTTDFLNFSLGIFNGYPAKSISEDNHAKDVLIPATVKPPVDFIKFFGYGWFGNMLMADTVDLAKNRIGGGAIVNYPLNEQMTVSLQGEYVMGTDEGVGVNDLKSAGYYGQLSFKTNPQIEFLGRYDGFDSNTGVDGNAISWITGGMNYFIDGEHAKISLNYIKKREEIGEYENDQFVMQFQIFF